MGVLPYTTKEKRRPGIFIIEKRGLKRIDHCVGRLGRTICQLGQCFDIGPVSYRIITKYSDVLRSILYSSRPDVTFAVDWELSNNYLSIYLSYTQTSWCNGEYLPRQLGNLPLLFIDFQLPIGMYFCERARRTRVRHGDESSSSRRIHSGRSLLARLEDNVQS